MTVCEVEVPDTYLEGIEGYSSVVTLDELRDMCVGSELLTELLMEVKSYSLKYLATVAEYCEAEITMTDEDRKDGLFESIDRRRSQTHDTMIGTFNALARHLKR